MEKNIKGIDKNLISIKGNVRGNKIDFTSYDFNEDTIKPVEEIIEYVLDEVKKDKERRNKYHRKWENGI